MNDIVQARMEEIGKMVKRARLDSGFNSRVSLIEGHPLKGKLTEEGLRKIEAGERVPRLTTIRRLSRRMGLSQAKTRKLERAVLEANISRAIRQAGNISVEFQIQGKPVKVSALPPSRKVELFVRGAVSDLVKVVEQYGVMEEDVEHFRRHARHILLKKLTT